MAGGQVAGAHSVLESSRPADGGTLDGIDSVALTFSEAPDPSLSTIQLVDHLGRVADLPEASAAPGDPRTLVLPTGELERGAYTVLWRVVSRLDGHATAGSLVFGIQVPPLERSPRTQEETTPISPLEVGGRWLLLTGLILLFGAAAIAARAFTDHPRGIHLLMVVATALAALGLVALATAQRTAAGVRLGAFLQTTVGVAVVGRGIGIATAAVGLTLLARRRATSTGLAMIVVGAAAAMFVDAAAGHAASAATLPWLAITLQTTHVAAAGVWIGGLAGLLIGIRGAPSEAKALAIRRFSSTAGLALGTVVATGTARALGELDSLGQLVTTTYGRVVLVKAAALVLLAVLGAVNRYRSLPAAPSDLKPLRRISAAELTVAAAAIGAAGVLMALAPPASILPIRPVPEVAALELELTNSDASLHGRIEVSPGLPGPNRFVAYVTDAAGRPLPVTSVTLRLAPARGTAGQASILELAPQATGTFAAIGNGLGGDGLWEGTLLVRSGDDRSKIAFELVTRCEATPLGGGEPQIYTLGLDGRGSVQGLVGGIGGGTYQVHFTFLDPDDRELRIEGEPVVTIWQPGTDPIRPRTSRLGPGHVAGEAELGAGAWSFLVVAEDGDGRPLFGCFEEALGP